MVARTRKEKLLDAILNSSSIDFIPTTREELFLAKILGMSVETPLPVLRIEKLYQALIDGNTPSITPVKRLECFVAAAAGLEVDLPTPITRVEFYWSQIAEASGGIEATVTGKAPLELSDALSKRIKKLVQYGKCAVSGGELYCNNGKLVAIDDELPSAYKRITGIKFDGDFWYDTGETLNGADDVTMTLANTSSSGQNVFGSYNGTASGTKNFSLYLYGGGSTSGCYLRYGEQLLRPKFGSNERTITFGKSGTSGFTTDVSATPETFTTEASAYIGMLPNSSSPAYTGSIIGSISVGTRLEWIPCERVVDGVIGYYEKIHQQFLEPIGTGTPVKGEYDSTHLNLYMVVGTPETLTLSASGTQDQTATVVDLFATDSKADEQDVISGKVVRNTEVLVSGGVFSVQALAEPVIESVAAQPMRTVEGSNSLDVTANVDDIEFEVVYVKSD